jgi:hypothetical protein
MPAYRIYWFDPADHVSEADYLIADADDEVRAGAAAHLGMASAVEVWHRARRVVRVSADKLDLTGGALAAGRLIQRAGT